MSIIDRDYYGYHNLPINMSITTISATCKLGVTLHLDNIAIYQVLDREYICSIKFGPIYRTILCDDKYTAQNFYNQLSLKMISFEKKIHIKLFRNGSVQMSGFKSIDQFNDVLTKLLYILDNRLYIINNNKPSILNFNIVMINTNTSVDMKISRYKLSRLLKSNILSISDDKLALISNIDCIFEPSIHSNVIIKFEYNNKTISIFVFQSGKIIITGSLLYTDIIFANEFIIELLCNNKYKIEINKLAIKKLIL